MALDYLSFFNRPQPVHGPHYQYERSASNLVPVIDWDFSFGDKNSGPAMDACTDLAVVEADFEEA